MGKEEKVGSSQSLGNIRVICAGLGRSGTLSLTEGLQMLGYRPYHYINFEHSHALAWTNLAEGKGTVNDVIDTIVRGDYDALLDNPLCDIYSDIL